MRGGLMGGGKNSLGGQLMGLLSSARGSSLLPLLQMLGGGKSPQPADLLQLLSALPKPASAPAPAADADQHHVCNAPVALDDLMRHAGDGAAHLRFIH